MRTFLRRLISNRTKNYYDILGVPNSASTTDIKKKFIELAKQYHPDINPTNTEKFKTINEAYSILSKENIRADYDKVYYAFTRRESDPKQPRPSPSQNQNFYNHVE